MPIVQAGNINITSLLVPDLYVQIVPPSQVTLNGVPSNLAAFVGTASWGPVNSVVSGSSYADYAKAFGPLINRKYDMGTHVGVAALQGMNNFECVRVTDGTEAAASVVVGSTNITFNGKYKGSFGNTISVTVQNGSKLNTFRFVVIQPGYVAEVFDNIGYTDSVAQTTNTAIVSSSVTIPVASTAGIVVGDAITGVTTGGPVTVAAIGSLQVTASGPVSISASGTALTFTPPGSQVWANAAAAINQGNSTGRPPSIWITATAGSGVTAPSVGTTYTLSGGTDGVSSVTATTLVGTDPGVGMYALRGSGFALVDVCDADTSSQWTTIDAFALSESAYAIQVAPAGNSVAQTVTAKQTAGLDSYNSKLLHGDWLYWVDPINQVTRLVSPQAFATGRLANLSPQLSGLNKTIYGVAGSQKSGLVGTVLSPYGIGDLNTLVSNGIEVICNPGGGGLKIWTMRFGRNSSSNNSIHGDNYTTLTNYVAKTLNAGMGLYLGQVANTQLFTNITATLTQFSQTLAGAGLIGKSDGSQPYSVQCNAQNNPPAQLQAGLVVATVQMSYLAIVQDLVVNLQNGTELSVSTNVVSNSH